MSEPSPTHTTVPQHFITLISNAFGIVAALAWADALSGFFQSFAVAKKHPVMGPFFYATVVTALAWFVGHLLGGYVKQACTRLCNAVTPVPTRVPTRQEATSVGR